MTIWLVKDCVYEIYMSCFYFISLSNGMECLEATKGKVKASHVRKP